MCAQQKAHGRECADPCATEWNAYCSFTSNTTSEIIWHSAGFLNISNQIHDIFSRNINKNTSVTSCNHSQETVFTINTLCPPVQNVMVATSPTRASYQCTKSPSFRQVLYKFRTKLYSSIQPWVSCHCYAHHFLWYYLTQACGQSKFWGHKLRCYYPMQAREPTYAFHKVTLLFRHLRRNVTNKTHYKHV